MVYNLIFSFTQATTIERNLRKTKQTQIGFAIRAELEKSSSGAINGTRMSRVCIGSFALGDDAHHITLVKATRQLEHDHLKKKIYNARSNGQK